LQVGESVSVKGYWDLSFFSTININYLLAENMADENLQQLQQEMDQFRNSLHGLGVATDNAGKNVDSFGQSLGKNLKGVAGGIGGLASSVQDGDQAFKQLNGVVNAVATALAGIPVIGGAAAGGLKLLFEQVQTTTKSFNDMSQVGAITAKGMTGLRDQINASGMSVEGFKRNITENAGVLARWSTTVGAGTTDFSKALGDITKTGAGDELRRLGFSADQIGETAGNFLKQQTLLGRQSTVTQDGLKKGTLEYARELDELAKLTGKSRADVAKQQQAALDEGKYLASQMELNAMGPAGEAAAKEIGKFQSQISAISPTIGKAIRDTASGNLAASKEAQELSLATNGKSQDILARLTAGSIDSITAQKELQEAMGENKEAARLNAKAVGDSITPFGKLSDIVAVTGAQMNKEGLVRKDLAESSEAAKKGTDGLTNDLISAQKNLESMSRQLFDIGTKMLPMTAKGIEYFTKAVEKSVIFINETITGKSSSSNWWDKIVGFFTSSSNDKKTTTPGRAVDKKNGNTGPTATTEVDSTVEIQKIEDERLKTIDGFKQRNNTLNQELTYNKNSLDNIKDTSKTNIEYKEKLRARNALIQKEINDLVQQQKEFDEAVEKRKTNAAKADLQKAGTAAPAGQKAGGAPGAPAAGGAGAVPKGASGVPGAAGGAGAVPKGASGAPGAAGGPPTVPGSPGGAAGAASGTAVSQENIDDLLKFSGSSGTKERFQQLDASLQEAVVSAAKEYKSLSGGKLLQINSAKRDSDDQKRLYDEWVAGGKKGKPVAPPGKSLHEIGFAIDIQNYNDPAAVKAMNNQGLSQKVKDDPVHFSAAEGGVLSGPTSGFRATLHGTEAVVPLSGGRGIPVEMPGFTDKLSEQISMMAMQMEKLDILIDTIRTGNKINKDILQVSRV